MNQRSCGSCVVFSFVWNFEESLRLRGLSIPSLSQQHLMNCGTGGQCNGAYGEQIAGDLVRLKTLHKASDYPYTASSGRCQTKQGDRHGKIERYQTIDGSVRSILAALHRGQPVSVGVAAGGAWGSYKSGVYSACNSMNVNHYVVITGVDCETSVDSAGHCVFDANGNLPAGVGIFTVQNSWGEGYGEKGLIRQKITNSRGQRCNAIAYGRGEAQILDTGIPMPESKPTQYTLKSPHGELQNVYRPNTQYTLEQAKSAFQKALDTLGR